MPVLAEERNDQALREALAHITTRYKGKRVGEQVKLIEGLRPEYHHSISLVEEAIPGQPSTWNYTCVQYAFNLITPPSEVIDIANSHEGRIFPSPKFAEFLIENELSELPHSEDCCVIVYANVQGVKHVGRVQGQLIVSKWGEFHLWRHAIYEIPAHYGSDVRFFKPISGTESVQAFMRYAAHELGRLPGT